MQITMVPGACSNDYQPTGGSFCESCFARWLVHSRDADLPCITAVADDGAQAQTLIMRHGAHQQRMLLDDAERERLAYGGWRGWVEWVEQLPVTAQAE